MANKRLSVRRLLALIIVIWFSIIPPIICSCSKDISTDDIDDESIWLQELTSPELNGRKTGTEGAKKTAEFIFSELLRMGHSPFIEDFAYKDSIIMRNIIVDIPGKNDSIIIIGAHYDGAVNSPIYQAANDNASGIISLLSIAKIIQPSQNSIMLCFWDGEENTTGTAFNGSSYFLQHFKFGGKIKCYCNIDCCGRNGDSIYLYYSPDMEHKFGNVDLTSSSLNVIKKISESNGSDYVPFKNNGIPFWGWNDYDVLRYIHTPSDSPEFISISKVKAVSNLTIQILNNL